MLQSDSGQKSESLRTVLTNRDKRISVIVGAAVKLHFPVVRVSSVLSGEL